MNKVVVYPGRFQPMLSHHAQVYQQLQAQFPDADVYIGTSDKVDGDKSPFNFSEKQLIAQAHGIDPSKVLQVKSPYNAAGYNFDPDNTVLIFAVGEKDLDRFPFNNVDPGTGLDMTVRGDPKPKYLQKLDSMDQGALPMSKRGYVTLAPTVKTGDAVASASAFRQQLKDAPDVESAKQVYTAQFGEYNDKIFDLIYNKIVGTNNMSEQLNYMRKLAGLQVEEGAPVNMAPGYAMTDADRKLADIGRLIMDMANQRPMGKGTPDSELEFQNMLSDFGGRLADGAIESASDLISYIKGAGEHAAELSNVVKQAMADYAAGKKADVQGEEVPDEPESEEEFEGVDLSDFYAVEEEIEDQVCPECDGSGCEACDDVGGDISEGADELQSLLAKFESDCQEWYDCYGDVDATRVQRYLDRGDIDGAAEEMTAAMAGRDGDEAPDEAYEMAKEMLADHMQTDESIDTPELGEVDEAVRDDNKESLFLNAVQDITKNAEEAGAYGDPGSESVERAYSYFQKGDFGRAVEEILGNFSDQDGGDVDALQGVYDDAVSDMEYLAKGVSEAVETTSHNAMQAAMVELRKLAGI